MWNSYKQIILVCIFLISSITSYSFRMDNIDFDQRIDKDGYQEYTVFNDSMKKIRYKVYLKNVGKLPVTKALEVYPKILTIEPKSKGKIKLFGKGGIELPKKELQFIMVFKPIIIPTLAKSSGKKEVISGTTTIPLAPEILMSGYVGEIDFSKHLSVDKINYFKSEKGKLIARVAIKNTAYSGLLLGLNFYNREKNVMDSRAVGRIPRNTVKNIDIELDSFKNGRDIKYIELYNSSLGTIVEQKI